MFEEREREKQAKPLVAIVTSMIVHWLLLEECTFKFVRKRQVNYSWNIPIKIS